MLKKILVVVIIAVIFFLSFGLIKQISEALQSGKRLESAVDNLRRLQQENARLKNRLTEVQSEDFIEHQARNKLNFVYPQETIVVISDEEIEKVKKIIKKEEIVVLAKWQKWLNLLLK